MQKHYPPKHEEKQFHCIHCGVYSAQYWRELFFRTHNAFTAAKSLDYCVCSHCHKWSYWYEGRMIIPSEAPVPPPHSDLPETCTRDYEEARQIVSSSPRAACALMRLTLQKLMAELG